MTTTTSDVDFSKIEELLSNKNFIEAKKIIDSVIDQELSPVQKGEIYVKVASMYLEITNRLNAEYLEQLDSTLALMKQVNSSEKQSEDTLKMAEVEQQLAANS